MSFTLSIKVTLELSVQGGLGQHSQETANLSTSRPMFLRILMALFMSHLSEVSQVKEIV